MKDSTNVLDGNLKTKEKYKLISDLLLVAEEIYHARVARGLSQGQLAKKIGTTQRIISNIENAEINVGIDLLLRIARALDMRFRFGECFLVDNKESKKVSGRCVIKISQKQKEEKPFRVATKQA